MRQVGWLMVLALLAGCSLFQSGTADTVATAVAAGQDAGDIACTAVSVKAPADVKLQVTEGLARAGAVLSSEDITSAALMEALGAVKDAQWRGVAQAALRVLLRRLNGGELPATIAKDSPAAAGTAAFVATCESVLGVQA